jgi:hypothetical protein
MQVRAVFFSSSLVLHDYMRCLNNLIIATRVTSFVTKLWLDIEISHFCGLNPTLLVETNIRTFLNVLTTLQPMVSLH